MKREPMTMLAMSLVMAMALAGSAATISARSRQQLAVVDLTGEWVMDVASHQMGLELEQTGTTVQGVLHAMGGPKLLVGTFIDGTLVGELSTNHGRMKWTGERFKKPESARA